VEARRLTAAADGDDAARVAAAARFLDFYTADTVGHFRDEEERIFPLVVDHGEEVDELLVRVLLEHQRIHSLTSRLEREVAGGATDGALMRELGDLLVAHVRLGERQLFPLIEATVSDEALLDAEIAPRELAAEPPVVDLRSPAGNGPLWGTESEDLNATLLAWPADGGPEEHVNSERDVLIVVLAGHATVTDDGEEHVVGTGHALVLEKGRARSIRAGRDGVRYLSIHRRRGPLQIGSAIAPRSTCE
jgi:quercetin dioxygenase-like cupin family protein